MSATAHWKKVGGGARLALPRQGPRLGLPGHRRARRSTEKKEALGRGFALPGHGPSRGGVLKEHPLLRSKSARAGRRGRRDGGGGWGPWPVSQTGGRDYSLISSRHWGAALAGPATDRRARRLTFFQQLSARNARGATCPVRARTGGRDDPFSSSRRKARGPRAPRQRPVRPRTIR